MTQEDGLQSQVVIIGSGPAGCTAAIYTARAGLSPILIAGAQQGGQLMITTEVENFPGFPKGVQGPELMEYLMKQAERFDAKMVYDDATEVDLSQRPFKVTVSGKKYTCDSLIVATGATARWLGLPNEEKFRGRGVSGCATCDGFFFKDKEVTVVGGGDTALEEALFLTRFCSKVTIVHRRDELRGSKIMRQRAFDDPKVEFQWDSIVVDVLGDEIISGVILENVKTKKRKEFPCEGMFVAIGHEPNTKVFKGQLDMDETGYLIVHDGMRTNVEGVFAAGDVQDNEFRQAVTAAGTGCMAAIQAERWLAEHAEGM